jgi:hypothetical protein
MTNADQLAEIRPALREVVNGSPNTCATLEIEGDSTKWLQIVDRTINAAYPYSESPEVRLNVFLTSPQSPKLINWEVGKFVTFEFPQIEVNTVSVWIDSYFVHALDCPSGDYHVDMMIEEI